MSALRKPKPRGPEIQVVTYLAPIEDDKRAGILFDAVLRSVQKANEREAREQEEIANGRHRDK